MKCIHLFLAALLGAATTALAVPNEPPIRMLSPTNGEVLKDFLAVRLTWEYPQRPPSASPFPFLHMTLHVADNPAYTNPIVEREMADNQNSWVLAVIPGKKYYWRLTPIEIGNGPKKYFTDLRAEATFTTGQPTNRFNANDHERYLNPRVGGHWQYNGPVDAEKYEPLSPWFPAKAYKDAAPPKLADIKTNFPVPVWEGHPEALDAYWYCWDTLLRVWIFAPEDADHQAVANLLGYRNWGPWGSTMVFDSCFILHFSRLGAQAWPFITCLDNCYARQHDNGFICRESDRANREVYATFPVNPPLFAWAEWEWYKITGDKERLRAVFTPIVKHYEWWMKYQRRENGLYWINGINEADDSPRNGIMYYSVSSSSYQALAALCLSRIAEEIDRPDLQKYFADQHEELGKMVNTKLFDQAHGLYNDMTQDGRFITELKPGVFCKHAHMFWPLIAEIAPTDRAQASIDEIANKNSFNRSSGLASLSADSAGYNKETGQYWCGAVWPSAQSMMQEGLKAYGKDDLLRALAEKYYNASLTAFHNQKTINENLGPDKPIGYGAPDFVGWGGIAPVANLIEYILGFDLDAPKHTITWHVTRPERHGIENLMFTGFKVSLISATRTTATEPLQLTVTSGGEFTLNVVCNGKATQHVIHAGSQTLSL